MFVVDGFDDECPTRCSISRWYNVVVHFDNVVVHYDNFIFVFGFVGEVMRPSDDGCLLPRVPMVKGMSAHGDQYYWFYISVHGVNYIILKIINDLELELDSLHVNKSDRQSRSASAGCRGAENSLLKLAYFHARRV
jgi:hypothetical protein